MMDLEITAMAEIAKALDGLEVDARGRVLRWAQERFGTDAPKHRNATAGQDADAAEPAAASGTTPMYESFPDFFDAINPQSGLDRLLVTAYWQQEIEGADSLEAARVNRELKHLGHQSGNITRDFTSLMSRSPRLVIQVRKKGSSKQARKQYRLTREGVTTVQRMLGE